MWYDEELAFRSPGGDSIFGRIYHLHRARIHPTLVGHADPMIAPLWMFLPIAQLIVRWTKYFSQYNWQAPPHVLRDA